MYKITAYNQDGTPDTDTVVVDAPSPGTAIEFFLVCHGMLTYYDIVLEKVDGPASAGYERWEVYKVIGYSGRDWTILERAHTWRKPDTEIEKDGFQAYWDDTDCPYAWSRLDRGTPGYDAWWRGWDRALDMDPDDEDWTYEEQEAQ